MESDQLLNQLIKENPEPRGNNLPDGIALAMFKVLAIDCQCEVCQLLRPAVKQIIQQMPAQRGQKLPTTRAIRRRSKANG
jgi:hypothetical protein